MFKNTKSYKKNLVYLLFLAGLFFIILTWKSNLYYTDSNTLASFYRDISTISGLLTVYIIMWQLILISRNPWLERLFGFDRLSVAHHWGGIFSLFLILSHGIFIILNIANLENSTFAIQFTEFGLVSFGLEMLSVFLFIIVAVMSMTIVMKRLKYETWYYVHLLTYLAIILGAGHQMRVGHDFYNNPYFSSFWILIYVLGLGNLVLFRFIRPFYYFLKHRFVVDRIEKDTENSFSIYIKGRKISDFPIISGQFMILRFLQRGYWQEAHPFSLSNDPKDNYLRITYKVAGDFTSKMSEIKKGTKVVIDGPNGAFIIHRYNNKKVLMIAAGSGISPIFSLIKSFLSFNREVCFIYINKKESSTMLKKEIDSLAKEHSNLMKVSYIMTDDHLWSGEKGRLDIDKIKKICPDFLEREIFVCGPRNMIDNSVKILSENNVKRENIHFEKFSFY